MLAGAHTLMTGLLGKARGPVILVSRSSTQTMTASPTAWALVSYTKHFWHLRTNMHRSVFTATFLGTSTVHGSGKVCLCTSEMPS